MNNKIKIYFIISIIACSCVISEKAIQYETLKDKNSLGKEFDFEIEFNKGKSFNHPTFVVWAEDMEGNFLKTIFLTKSYASGIFGHQIIGDTIWMPKEGPSYQPAALPYWSFKKGAINKDIIPTPENPYVDAFTGATPKGSFKFETIKPQEKFRLMVEINQSWDWNKYWINNKYPESQAYKHSAQPSLIYSVCINNSDSIFYLNPIGHGNPSGKDGKLFTDISTFDSAKQIFPIIKAIIK